MVTADKSKQSKMDETLDDSFPASDPPSWSTPKEHPEKQLKDLKQETKGRPDAVSQKSYSKKDYMTEHGNVGSRHH